MRNAIILVSLITCAYLADSCARNPVTGKKQVVLMSERDEIAMGQQADPQIIAQFGLYEDSALQRYVAQKGQQIVAISHRKNIAYHFRVLNSEVVNAFAVPGGYIYMTRGIMSHFNSEADFIGVLSHEIGHVAYRHSVSQQRNQILSQVGILVGVIVAPQLGQFIEAASAGLQLLMLKNSRDDERESDELGVEYSTKVGYDAREMAKFFNTLKRQQTAAGAELPEMLSTHPDPGDRYNTVNKLAAEWQAKLNLTNPMVNRNDYLRRIEGIVYGEDPREGFRQNNTFYHPVLRFQFPIPQGWNYQNTPMQVQMAPQDGRALMFLRLSNANSLQAAADSVLRQYRLVLVERRSVTVNGLPAIYMIADQQPQQQGQPALRTQSTLIQLENNIYHMLGVSTINDFNNYVNSFNLSMQGFRTLTDPTILNKRPDRIRLRTATSTMTLAQFFRQQNVPESKLEEYAILNGMLLTDNVSNGMLIKVVGQ